MYYKHVGIFFPLKNECGAGMAIFKKENDYYYAKYTDNFAKIICFIKIKPEKFKSMLKRIILVKGKEYKEGDDALACFVLSFKKGKVIFGNKRYIMEHATDIFLSEDDFEIKERIVYFVERFLPLMT